MTILILLPALSFLLLTLIIFSKFNAGSTLDNIRIAIVNSFIIYSLFIVVITEMLSYLSLIRFDTILTFWLFISSVLGYYSWRTKAFSSLFELLPALKRLMQREAAMWLILLLLTGSLIVALAYPVNNFDSLTYHMARVGHWEQNQSISHYKTHILRQIEFSPFAEWTILHFQILCGGDRFANSIQLIFFIGCICCVSLISKSLGANRRQQLLSSVAACFIPMAILESNTTQNDIVVSLFILAFVYYTLRLTREVKFSVIFLSGVSLGLAWLTKGSAYLFTSVFCAWYIVLAVKSLRRAHFFRRIALFGAIPLIAILINSGHFYRNIFFSDSPMGNEGKGTTNAAYEVRPLILVSVKNLMNHLLLSRTMKEKIVIKAASVMGIDPEDGKYNLTTMEWVAGGISFHEDYAQNFFHTVLIFICMLTFFFRKRSRHPSGGAYLFFVLSVVTLTFLFSILLKWQPWSGRLVTPLFLLFSVFLAIEVCFWPKRFSTLAFAAVVVYGFVALCYSSRHPILPIKKSVFSRNLEYDDFIYGKDLPRLKQYLDSKPYKKIGVYIGPDSWDYVYYKLLRGNGADKRLLRHMFVINSSAMYVENFVPDVILSLEVSAEKYDFAGKDYYRTFTTKDGVLFEPKK
jgi:4-amino-4-deoxy-L-arabinose transferase-like glycosyltransferase